MNDDPSQVLNDLGDLIPDRRPTTSTLLTMARAAKRRRDRRRGVLVVAIAGASIASGALFFAHFNSSSGELVASPGSTPVISMPGDDGGYPDAEVSGELKLVGDCLMLEDSAVFWPHGTTWDANAHAVVFPDSFDTPPVDVGSSFVGGGGYYTVSQAIDILGPEYGQPLGACAKRSGNNQVVYAVPAG